MKLYIPLAICLLIVGGIPAYFSQSALALTNQSSDLIINGAFSSSKYT
jgi:hypothetical protein